jgi:hypothetical protein
MMIRLNLSVPQTRGMSSLSDVYVCIIDTGTASIRPHLMLQVQMSKFSPQSFVESWWLHERKKIKRRYAEKCDTLA